MDLASIWFIVLAYLFCGFFFLEGFDFGVGIVTPFMSKEDDERRMMLTTIGGFWDGNEVWMVTAGAAMFAAFPHWYASLFSGFFPLFVFILLALFCRGVGVKFRNHRPDNQWRFVWDWLVFAGSLACPFLWGVVIGNLLRGVPINEHMTYVGGFFNLLNPYALVFGTALTALAILHGSIFLGLKTSGEIMAKIQRRLIKIYIPVLLIAVVFIIYSAVEVGLFRSFLARFFLGCAVFALVLSGLCLKRFPLFSFFMSGTTIVAVTAAVFAHLYPNFMISSLNPAWNLTVENASSSHYSLKVQSFVALIFIPTILFYQGWTYWVLRHRIVKEDLAAE